MGIVPTAVHVMKSICSTAIRGNVALVNFVSASQSGKLSDEREVVWVESRPDHSYGGLKLVDVTDPDR